MPSAISATLEDGKIWVRYSYDDDITRKLQNTRQSTGGNFVGHNKPGGPAWRFPLEYEVAKRLKETFGDNISFDKALLDWGREEKFKQQRMIQLANAVDADFEILPDLVPELAANIREYQKAGIKFGAIAWRMGRNWVNSDQPGLGKTRQLIGAVYEAGPEIYEGPKLVAAPLGALESVWQRHLDAFAWEGESVLVATGDRNYREEILGDLQLLVEAKEPFWFVTNPAMLTYRKTGEFTADGKPLLKAAFPELYEIDWKVVVADESHKMGLQNPSTQTAMAFTDLVAEYRAALTGTPVGGNPVKMWGLLHWLNPKEFKAKWRFIDQWLDTVEVDYFVRGGHGAKDTSKKIVGIKKNKEEAFYNYLKPYVLRRTKREVAPELPPKTYVPRILVEMTPKQRKQYIQMALEAEVAISELEIISATSILAEYTRLKQFANTYSILGDKTLSNGKKPVIPTAESGKLPALMELLNERGIFPNYDEDVDGEQVVIFSQFTAMVDFLEGWLQGQGIKCVKITGSVKAGDRLIAEDAFQKTGGARVMLMNTMIATAITLDKADTVIFMDETWVPDDQEQAEDRLHRISRIHNVTVYYIAAVDTVEQTIEMKVGDKALINTKILDLYREGYRATMKGSE